MKGSTTIGLLVGGTILVLAAAPRSATGQIALPGSAVAPAAPAPFGNINPFNWFGNAQQQPSNYMVPGANYANPYATPAGGLQQTQYDYSGYGGGGGQIGVDQSLPFADNTAGSGFQDASLDYSGYDNPFAGFSGFGDPYAAYGGYGSASYATTGNANNNYLV